MSRSRVPWGPIVTGVALGVLSAAEERTSGFDVGISTDGVWLALAFVLGARAGEGRQAALHGAIALTVANLSYYNAGGEAPGVGVWLVLGLAGGGVFGWLGRLWRTSGEPVRVAAALALAGVWIVEGSEIWTADGEADDAVELAAGLVLAPASARTGRGRFAAAAAGAGIAALASTGVLDPLLP